jgi:hypothetical protein
MSEITALVGALKGLWWPVAAVIIAAVYKVEVRSLLPRLRRAGPLSISRNNNARMNDEPPAPGIEYDCQRDALAPSLRSASTQTVRDAMLHINFRRLKA